MSDVLEAIGGMDSDELDEVVQMIKVRRNHIAKRLRKEFEVGQVVEFTGRRNIRWRGKITKVNRKRVKVLASSLNTRLPNTVTWNVPFEMLETD